MSNAGLAEGTLLLERYRVDRQIGRGGMARVFKAIDERTGKTVAVKEVGIGSDQENLERLQAWFKRELKALWVLDHPGVLRLVDHGISDDDHPFVVTEYLDGSNLADLVQVRKACSEPVAVAIAVQALAALEAAHQAGIVHRDIKPANLFLCKNGRVVVLDFGVARATSSQWSETLARGLDTKIVGTPQFLSPEQLRGVSLSAGSDLYSLGASLFLLTSGRLPYGATTTLELIRSIAENKRQRLDEVAPQLRPETVRAIEHLLQHSPADRPANATEAKREFEAIVAHLPGANDALRNFAASLDSQLSPVAAAKARRDDDTPSASQFMVGATVVDRVPQQSETPITPIPDAPQHTAVTELHERRSSREDTQVGETRELEFESVNASHTQIVTATAPVNRRRRGAYWLGGGLVVIAALLTGALLLRQPAEPPINNIVIDAPTPSTKQPAKPAVAPPPVPAPSVVAKPEPEVKHEGKPEAAKPEAKVETKVDVRAEPKVENHPKAKEVGGNGRLTCELEQWAEIIVDGKSYGVKQIAASISLPVGRHHIVFKHGGQTLPDQVVTIKHNEDTPVRVDFGP